MAGRAMWILLIKDDEKPRRLRMRTFVIVMGITVVLFITGLSLGIKGIFYLEDFSALRRDIRTLNMERRKNEQDLAQLQQRLQDLQALFSGYHPPDNSGAEDAANATDAGQDENGDQGGLSDAGDQGGENNATTGQTLPEVNLNSLFTRVDLGIVNVDGLAFSPQGDRELHVSYDLTNRSGSLQTGYGQVLLILRGGREVVLPTPEGALYFEIRNFKKVDTTGTLPPDLEWEDVYAMALRIHDLDGRTLLRVVRVPGGH